MSFLQSNLERWRSLYGRSDVSLFTEVFRDRETQELWDLGISPCQLCYCWTCAIKVFCTCPANLWPQNGIIPNALFTSLVLLFIWIIPSISASSECVSCALWYNNPESPQWSDTNVLTLQCRIPQGPSVAWIWLVAELHSNPWTIFFHISAELVMVCVPFSPH